MRERNDPLRRYFMFPPHVRGDTLLVDIEYPRSNPVKFVRVGLTDVRASDDVRISFDFDRNGWKIERPTIHSWSIDDPVCDEGWTEVALVPARKEDDE